MFVFTNIQMNDIVKSIAEGGRNLYLPKGNRISLYPLTTPDGKRQQPAGFLKPAGYSYALAVTITRDKRGLGSRLRWVLI